MLIGINEMRRNGNPETKIMKMEIFFFLHISNGDILLSELQLPYGDDPLTITYP